MLDTGYWMLDAGFQIPDDAGMGRRGDTATRTRNGERRTKDQERGTMHVRSSSLAELAI